MINIELVMLELGKRFTLFHSEDDFKFQLAWIIKEMYPMVIVNLERKLRPDLSDRTDLVVSDTNLQVPIELKYKTTKLDAVINAERFILKYQGARDYARYDFLRDISRIESLVRSIDSIIEGYAIIITMDQSILKEAQLNTNAASFPIHQGNTIHGNYSFAEKAKEKNLARSRTLSIKGKYQMKWYEYSRIEVSNRIESLYCLIVKVSIDFLIS